MTKYEKKLFDKDQHTIRVISKEITRKYDQWKCCSIRSQEIKIVNKIIQTGIVTFNVLTSTNGHRLSL